MCLVLVEGLGQVGVAVVVLGRIADGAVVARAVGVEEPIEIGLAD